ncbi:MAG: hypothetical protein NC828_01695 [Candidatus Omnitrophica bacterium]|nr:hypothetical protein [Candidatus Omnitrophota bacterium]
MKKLLTVITLIMTFGIAASAYAAQLDTLLTIKVKVKPSISVDIAETELSLGDVTAGGFRTSMGSVTVTNNGSGINETYSLSLANPSRWTAVQDTTGVEKYILNAAFDADGNGIAWDNAKHALSTDVVSCSVVKFAGDQTGVAVPYNEVRKLWFQFKAPTATSVTTEQSITVTVTAQAS